MPQVIELDGLKPRTSVEGSKRLLAKANDRLSANRRTPDAICEAVSSEAYTASITPPSERRKCRPAARACAADAVTQESGDTRWQQMARKETNVPGSMRACLLPDTGTLDASVLLVPASLFFMRRDVRILLVGDGAWYSAKLSVTLTR
jgi:hypothetical protein